MNEDRSKQFPEFEDKTVSITLNNSKKKILEFLLISPSKENDYSGKTIIEIADAVDLSTIAIRNYLIELEKMNYVVSQTQKRDIGRPAVLYSIHSNALDLFPKAYAEFAVTLITELKKELGKKRTQNILAEVGKTISKEIKITNSDETDHSTLEQRIVTLVKIFEEYGKYPTVLEDEEYYYIRNSNCLLFSVVKEHSIVCEADFNIVKSILQSHPEKQECLKNEDSYCQYRIKKE